MLEKLSVIAADIDGTLAMKGGDLMPKTRAALQRLHREGVKFGVASGRPLDRRIIDKAKDWSLGFPFDFAIGMNGGELYDRETGEIEKIYQLSKEDVFEIVSFLAPLDVNCIIYINGYDDIAALRMDAFMIDSQKRNNSHVRIGGPELLGSYDTGKVEVHLKPKDEEEIMKDVEAHASDRYSCIKTFAREDHITIEFIDPRVNKGMALRKYSELKNIPLSEFMAFGDMENDLELLKTAAWGVCLKNGSDAVKEIAQAVTEYDVYNDGVGNYLETYWFDRK